MDNKRQLFLLLSAEFYDFKGFIKPRIKLLECEFVQKLQILNSTNGCGKSTFILELNPFSINKSLFRKNGWKKIRFQYGEKVYELYSSHKTNKLYDMDDPETNLCGGGTISQLHSKMEELFNITPFMWAAAMGSMEFTASNKEVRRRWIELISGIDLDYPFLVLNKLTKAISASRNITKHLNTQLATESCKLIKVEDIQNAVLIQETLTQDVKSLLMSRDLSIDTTQYKQIQREIEKLQQVCGTINKQYNALDKVLNPFSDLNTIELVREAVRDKRTQIDLITVSISGLITLQEDKTGLLKRVEDSGKVDIKKITEEIAYHQECLDSARTICTGGNRIINQYLRDSEGAMNFCSKTDILEFNFADMVTQLGLSDDSLVLTVPEDYRMDLNARLKDLDNLMTQSLNSRGHFEEAIQHQRASCKDVKCPKCSTEFQLGESALNESITKLDLINAKIASIEPKLADLTVEWEDISLVYATREAVYNHLCLKLDTPWYTDYLKTLINEGCTLHILNQTIRKDSSHAYYIGVGIDSSKELQRLNGIKESYERVCDLTDIEGLDLEVTELTNQIRIKRKEREDLQSTINELTNVDKLATQHIDLLTQLHTSLTKLTETRKSFLQVMDNVVLEQMERDLQLKLAAVTKKINDNDILVNLIDSLTVMRDESERKLVSYKILDKALNTSTGIIGEQLVEYTKAFTHQVTDAISQLWGYPLTILPCDISGKKGMDYMFPFDVGGGDEPVGDISLGSKSQVSVINLAIMLCTRISLGLDRLPLFLDEIGGGFDTTHNQRLGEFVRMLLSDYDCSNIFLVHHDVAVRNMLGPRDTIVFDDTQVIVEPNYNQYVKLTHY